MKNIAILTGGDSAEYDISILSANTVSQHLNPHLFNGYIIQLKEDKFIALVNEKKIIINKKIKTVLISIPSHPQKKDVDIFIPVGTPGLDHNSHLLRIDKVVSLPLKKIRNISLPSVDYVLNKAGEI